MATQKNSGGWRGNRPAPQNTPHAAPATPGWKQSSARAATAKPGFSTRRKTTLFLSLFITTALAWFLALIFLPSDKLETFVIIPGTPATSGTAVHIHSASPPAAAPGNNDLNPVSILAGKPTTELDIILNALNGRNSYRKPAAAVIINLQVVPVPSRGIAARSAQDTPQSTTGFLLLPRQITSTELQGLHDSGAPPAAALSPEELKDSIQKLLADVPNTNVLLLLDQPAPLLAPLHGLVQFDVVKTIASWTKEPQLAGLAVIAAADDQHYSLPDPTTSSGQTAFAASCEAALTGSWQEIDSDQNKRLSAAEFEAFVSTNTHSRLAPHYGPDTPKVLSEGNFNFELLREPLKPSTTAPARPIAAVIDELSECFKKASSGTPASTATWRPIRTQTLHNALHNAQLALLARNTDLATRFLQTFNRELEKFPGTDSFIPPPARADSETPDNTPEKIFANALATRGNLVPSIAELTEPKDALVNNRRLAELAATQAFASADLLQPLLLPREDQQLLDEDRFLANATSPAPEELLRHQQFLEAASGFAKTRSNTHSFLTTLFTQLPQLIEYCRLTNPDNSDIITEILSPGLRYNDADRDELRKLLRNARGQFAAAKPDTLHPRTATLLIATRLLRIQFLDPLPKPAAEITPDSTSATIELLNSRAAEMQSLLNDATADKTEIDRILNELVTEQINKSLETGNPLHQIHESARCCRLLIHAPLNPDQRRKIFESLSRIESAGPKPGQPTPAAAAPKDSIPNAAAPTQSPNTPHALHPVQHSDLPWLLQLTRLLPSCSDNLNSILSTFPDAPSQLTADELGRIGSGLQAEWASAEKRQLNSLKQLDSTQALRVADLRVRLLPPEIAQRSQNILPPDPQPEISSRLWQQLVNDYRNLHIERLRLSRWVQPTDQPPLADNGWYAREIQRWQATPQTNPPSLEPALEIESAIPEVRFANDLNPTLQVPVRITNPSSLSGIAALQLLPPDQPDSNAQAIQLPQPEIVSLLASGGRQKLSFKPQIQGGTARPAPCAASDFQSASFFRGRTASLRSITINPCEAREWIVTRTPHPTNSSVEVTSTSLSPVAFVLDWSSSMTEKDGDVIPRYEEAAQALQTLINEQIQAGYVNARQVSLRVFGHRVGYAEGNPQKLTNNDYESAFRDFQFPRGEEAKEEFQSLIKMTFINDRMSDSFKDVLDRLRTCKPFGWSPLYESIHSAVSNDLANQSGLVVAVTDGIPADGPSDPIRNKLPALLQRLNALNGRVQVLILCMVPTETNRIQQQLDDTLPILGLDAERSQLLRESFLISTAENTKRITAEINLATKPAPLELINGAPPSTFIEGQINPEGSGALVVYGADQLAPEQTCRISLRAQRSDTAPLTAEFPPLPGGKVLLEADWKNKSLKFKHEVGTELSVPVERPPETPGTPIRLVVAEPPQRQNRGQLADVQLQVLLDHDDYTKHVPLPAEVEFCYSAPTGFPSAARIEESFQSYKGCPAWKVNITGWNPDGRLRVHAFWKMNRSTPDEQISLVDALALNSPSLARPFESANIPKLRLWSFITENTTLQVRIDPAPPYQEPTPGSHQKDANSLHSIQISLVEKDATGQLQPVPASVTARRLENGSAVYEFRTPANPNPPWNTPSKDRLHITLTSLKKRLENALTTTTDLQLD